MRLSNNAGMGAHGTSEQHNTAETNYGMQGNVQGNAYFYVNHRAPQPVISAPLCDDIPFTGEDRTGELARVVELITSTSPPELMVLYGDSGVGKSRLALECLREWTARTAGSACFVDFRKDPTADLARFGVMSGVVGDGHVPLQEVADLVRCSRPKFPTLFVYDDVPDEDTLKKWLPTSPGVITLVTSTFNRWPPGWKRIFLERSTAADERALMRVMLEDEELISRFGEGILQRSTGVTIELVEVCRTLVAAHARGFTPTVEMLPGKSKGSFAFAWGLLESDDAREAIAVASLFRVGRLPWRHIESVLKEAGWQDERILNARAGALDRRTWSLVKKDGSVEMHSLWREFVRKSHQPPPEILSAHLRCFSEAVRAFLESRASLECRESLVVFETSLSWWEGYELRPESCDDVGTALREAGLFEEALPWYERAVAAAEKGDIHQRVDYESLGRSLHEVGYCHSSLGRYEEALLCFKRAVAAAETGDIHQRVDYPSLGRSLQGVGEGSRQPRNENLS